MNKTERIILWTIAGVAGLWLLLLTVIVAGELGQIRRDLTALAGGGAGVAAEGTAAPDAGLSGLRSPGGESSAPAGVAGGNASPVQVGIAGVTALTDSVAMTVTVRAYGAGDLLFEPPALVSAEGVVYPATAESLEAARFAFLDLVTRGQATACFEFVGRLTPTEGLWLVFNPGQEEGSVITPRVEVAVPLRAGAAAEE